MGERRKGDNGANGITESKKEDPSEFQLAGLYTR
jgi:hypothetical protein